MNSTNLLYLLLLLPMEHRPPISILQPTLSSASLSSSIQILFILLMSISISQRNVLFGLPILLWLWKFQVRACLVTQSGAIINVCHIHFLLQTFWPLLLDLRYIYVCQSSSLTCLPLCIQLVTWLSLFFFC